MSNKNEIEFWLKVKETRNYNIKIKDESNNKIKFESNKKIVKSIKICLENIDILEGICELYKRYKLIRISINFILKYYKNI
tara:strand:- start:4298 stop:4540 length:243 start_codon:yes stop_codon:yes gene_type:complete